MRILVITRAPWRNDNNTGNTMSNFFGDMKDCQFYNLYFRDQKPMNDIAIKSFALSEAQLVKNLVKGTGVGRVICENDAASVTEEKIYSSAKKHSSTFLMLLRDMLWTFGRWKSENFTRFLEEVKPDLVFMPVFNCFYPHKALRFVKKQTGAKIVLFHADDNYTLKQFSFSPLYWLYRFNLRKWVRRSVKISDLNYAISYLQKQEYEKSFKKDFKILTKGADFSGGAQFKMEYAKPLQLVFTGNIISNRWKSLACIANTLERINANGIKAQLRIYTGNQLTDKMSTALNRGESSFIMGSVSAEEVKKIQSEADMLVHVEALDLKNKLTVRQSFSTKIVDYFAVARPILAFGPKDVASIDHLLRNDCAVVADSEQELYDKLLPVIHNNEKLQELSLSAFHCGERLHSKHHINEMLIKDMKRLFD